MTEAPGSRVAKDDDVIERIDYDGGTGNLKITFAPVGVRTLAAEAAQRTEASK